MLQLLRQWGLAALLITAVATPCLAQGKARQKFIISETGRKTAIVVGVSTLNDETLKDRELSFVENDARRMIETLFDDGFIVYPLCDKSVPTPKPATKREKLRLKERQEPTKENIEQTVGKVLTSANEKDVVLVYFSGHGLASKNKKGENDKDTYLVPKNADLTKPNGTCVSVAHLRQLMADSATRCCLLALDSCHSGGTRSVNYTDFEHFVEGGPAGVATFASCSLNQISQGWTPDVYDPNDVAKDGDSEDHDVSIFTYWFNAGLKGFADGALADVEEGREANGKIETDELFAYVDRHVELHSAYAEQTTQVIARRDATPFVLCDVKPMIYDDAMRAVAKQIVTKARLLNKNDVKLNVKTIGGENWESDAKAADGLFSFAKGAKNALQKSVDSLMEEIGAKSGDDEPVSVGVNATVQLLERDYENAVGEIEEIREYVMICRFDDSEIQGQAREVKAHILPRNSGETFENDAKPTGATTVAATQTTAPPPSATKPTSAPPAPVAPTPTVVDPLDDAPEYANAFTLPDVTIQASLDGGKTWATRPIYRGSNNANWVELNPGETYRVVVWPSKHADNPQDVGLRLLIDGCNTLAQAENHLYGSRSAVPAPIVRLDEARWWFLNLAKGGVYDGFYRLEGDAAVDSFDARGNLFEVAPTTASGSNGVATTGQNGMIDVAFYALRGSRDPRPASDVRTREGGDVAKVFEARSGYEVDYQLACFRLRYASAARLAELGVGSNWLAGSTTVATTQTTQTFDDEIGVRSAKRTKKLKVNSRNDDDYENDDENDETPSSGVLR